MHLCWVYINSLERKIYHCIDVDNLFLQLCLYICEMIEFMNINVHYVINGTPMFVQVRTTLSNIYYICHFTSSVKETIDVEKNVFPA